MTTFKLTSKPERICLPTAYGPLDKVTIFRLEEGLECLWIVAGERNAWPSGNPMGYACRSFAGVYRWTGTKWMGEKWHTDKVRAT